MYIGSRLRTHRPIPRYLGHMVREYGVGQVSCWVGEVREEGRHNADCEGSKGRERCTDYGSPDFDDAPVERSYCLVCIRC